MAAAWLDLIVDQGRDYIDNWYYTDNDQVAIDITGYTGTLVISTDFIDGTTIATYTTSDYLTITGATGLIHAAIPAAITAAYDAGQNVHELYITSSGGVKVAMFKGNYVVRGGAD